MASWFQKALGMELWSQRRLHPDNAGMADVSLGQRLKVVSMTSWIQGLAVMNLDLVHWRYPASLYGNEPLQQQLVEWRYQRARHLGGDESRRDWKFLRECRENERLEVPGVQRPERGPYRHGAAVRNFRRVALI